jgi:AcrR family transcriptional regulator
MDAMTSRPQSAARRKPAEQRRAEMIEAAAGIAVRNGLDKVTAKRVAAALGVRPGLVDHYFSADQLVAAAFAHAASAERNELFDEAESVPDPVARLRCLMTAWLEPGHDDFSLLWLDAWQACRHRPALREEVAAQMNEDVRRLAHLIKLGVDSGQLRVDKPDTAALQIMSLVDALSVQSAIRGTFDFTEVRTLVTAVTEQILGLLALGLLPAPDAAEERGPFGPGGPQDGAARIPAVADADPAAG